MEAMLEAISFLFAFCRSRLNDFYLNFFSIILVNFLFPSQLMRWSKVHSTSDRVFLLYFPVLVPHIFFFFVIWCIREVSGELAYKVQIAAGRWMSVKRWLKGSRNLMISTRLFASFFSGEWKNVFVAWKITLC